MKGVQETCCMCTTPIDDNSVHFLCNCLITICKECAYEQLARNRSTFRSHIVCPVCGSQECNIANQAIDGIEKAEYVERELIKQACTYFKESRPQSFQKKVSKLIPLYRKLIVSFTELGYPSLRSPFVDGNSRDDVNVLGLHVARCEAHRQEIEREHGTSNFIPFESRPDFALGPLEKVILKPNHTLEKILDIATGRDREANRLQLHCPSCYESLGPGNTVRMMCSCFTYNCQLCQRRIMKNYKNTFRDSPAKCNTCNSYSIPFENIAEARDLETTLLKQHPMFKTTASVHMLWHIYAEIADLCKMDRAIAYNDFIDQNAADLGRGSNNYCSKAMCFLEMARMEVERTRRKFYDVPQDERSDVSNLPLGPLARLRIRRHVFLEAFINFVHGTEASSVTVLTDEEDSRTMKDPDALFDETTNRLVEKDGPGGDLEPAVVRQIQQEAQAGLDEAKNRTYSLLLRTKSAPCPHPNCTFDANCPVYLEQHINAIHVQHLDEAEVIVPKKRPNRKAAQAAQTAIAQGAVMSLEDFGEDDLNRALAESLITSGSGRGSSSSSTSRASARPELHFREDEQIEEEEESDNSDEVVVLEPQRMTRAQRQSASAASVASRAAEASRMQAEDSEEGEFVDELPSRPSRRSSPPSRAVREPAPESPEEEKEVSQEELRELLGESDSPEQKARKKLSQKHKPNKHHREVKHALLPETVTESHSSSGSELESASDEEEREDILRTSAVSARSASPSTSSSSSSQRAVEGDSGSSQASSSVEQASHRIKKRKAAYLEDSDEEEAIKPTERSHHSKHASRDKEHKDRGKERDREKDKEKERRHVAVPGSRSTKPFPERPTSAPPTTPVAGGFNLATAMAAASTAAAAATAAANSAERQSSATAPLGPAVSESGKDPAPATSTMHARQRRREVLLEANKAHQLAEESDTQRRAESPEHVRPDKRVRFAPVVECQEYIPPVHTPEVVELDVEDKDESPEAPVIPEIERIVPPKKDVVDFFSIVDRLKSSRIIPPPLPPTPPPPVSLAPPPVSFAPPPLVTLIPPVITTPVPPARVAPEPVMPMGVQYIGTRPPSPPRPPEPPSDEEDDADSTEGPHAVPTLPYLQLRPAKNERDDAVTPRAALPNARYAYATTNTSEEFIRQGEARYYHEPYRSERTDEQRARAKPYSVPGLPYAEDMNRFAHEVLQEPSEAWRAGEEYVDLTRPAERRYELVFDIDKPRPANAAALLNVRAKFMLRFPNGALKKMAESTPCKERGYSQVEIKMETMQAELVAVLNLIALPRFGFRGKIAQWGTTRDTLLQAKGTFHKYGIMPDTFITLRDLSLSEPGFMTDERVKAPPPLTQAQLQVMLPAGKGRYQRKQRNRPSNAEFALMSEEKKRLAREAEKQAINRAAMAQYGVVPGYTQHAASAGSVGTGSAANQSPTGSATSGTSSARAAEPPRVRLDRFGEPMDGPRTGSKGASSAFRANGADGASNGRGADDQPEKAYMATPPAVSTPSASTPSLR